MSSAKLHVFCLPEELIQWVVKISFKYNLSILSFTLENDAAEVHSLPSFNEIPSNIFKIYLCPADVAKKRTKSFDRVHRDWGWIQIKPGHFAQKDEQKILLLTEFHAADAPTESTRLAKCIKWLKKTTKEQITFGVVGENIVLGGKSEYKDIGFTKEAVQALNRGAIWKQQVVDRSVFTPK